jgi:hypothetical protein
MVVGQLHLLLCRQVFTVSFYSMGRNLIFIRWVRRMLWLLLLLVWKPTFEHDSNIFAMIPWYQSSLQYRYYDRVVVVKCVLFAVPTVRLYYRLLRMLFLGQQRSIASSTIGGRFDCACCLPLLNHGLPLGRGFGDNG